MQRVLGVLAAGLLLAGCSGSDAAGGPSTLPPLSPSPAVSVAPTATPTPGVSGVSVPPEAMAETPAGAEAFARYFFEVFDMAYEQLDATAIATVTLPSCRACQGFVADLTRTQEEGAVYEGGQTKVFSAAAPPLEGGSTDVLVQYAASDLLRIDADGSRSVAVPGEVNAVISLRMTWTENSWRVAEVSEA